MEDNEHESPKPVSEAEPQGEPSSDLPHGDPPQAAATPEPFRYGTSSDVPTWAQGRTADEILKTASDLYAALQRGETASAPASSGVDVSNFNTQSVNDMTPSSGGSGGDDVDPNLLYSDPAAFTQRLRDSIRREMRSEMQQAAGSLTTPLASMAKHQAMQNPKRKLTWEKYGPEIETIVARLPEHARARPEIWDEAARMVAGEHVDELAQAKAEEIIRRGSDSGMLPSQGGPPAPSGSGSSGSPLAKLFDARDPAVKGFIDDGIPLEKVRSHYRKRGYTKDEDIVELLTRTKKKVAR